MVAIGLVGLTAWLLRAELGLVPDLAFGRPWRASSGFGGIPAAGRIAAPTEAVFFHSALEGEPSFVLDLENERRIRGLELENRLDCCQVRAVPLFVDVSVDGKHWHNVARRDAPFQHLRLGFPAVRAKLVRLRVERETYFHLVRVGVY
jgi:hypothetical protein